MSGSTFVQLPRALLSCLSNVSASVALLRTCTTDLQSGIHLWPFRIEPFPFCEHLRFVSLCLSGFPRPDNEGMTTLIHGRLHSILSLLPRQKTRKEAPHVKSEASICRNSLRYARLSLVRNRPAKRHASPCYAQVFFRPTPDRASRHGGSLVGESQPGRVHPGRFGSAAEVAPTAPSRTKRGAEHAHAWPPNSLEDRERAGRD